MQAVWGDLTKDHTKLGSIVTGVSDKNLDKLPEAIKSLQLEEQNKDKRASSVVSHDHPYNTGDAVEPEKDKFSPSIEVAEEATEKLGTSNSNVQDTPRRYHINRDTGAPRCPPGCTCSWCNARARI